MGMERVMGNVGRVMGFIGIGSGLWEWVGCGDMERVYGVWLWGLGEWR